VLGNKLQSLLKRNRPHFTLHTSASDHEVTLTQEAPLVTIVGEHGYGKSLLAMQLAEQLLAQEYGVTLFTTTRRYPGDPGYLHDKASRQLLHLETGYRDVFRVMPCNQVTTAEIAMQPKRQLVIIDDMRLLAQESGLASELIRWADQNASVVVLLASAPQEFYRIGLTDKHTRGVSLMLIGRLDSQACELLPEPLSNRLGRIRYRPDNYAEYLAIAPIENWSDVVRVDLPQGVWGRPNDPLPQVIE